jgi:hypothetical protein
MSYFFGDSFDFYTTATDAAIASTLPYWDSVSINTPNSSFVTGRFGGLAAQFEQNAIASMVKTSGVNDSVHHFNFAVQIPAALTAPSTTAQWWVELFDGTTAQCTLSLQPDGTFALRSGTQTGTIIATIPASLAVSQSALWYAFEFEIVISPTAGSVTMRRNGNPVNDFQATGLNTRASANSYANKVTLGGNAGPYTYVDDILWRSDAASGSGMATWGGDVRCYARRPNTDAQAQWTRSSPFTCLAVPPAAAVNTGNSNTAGFGFYSPLVSPGGSITGAAFQLTTGYTSNWKCAIFSSVGGKPGTLIQSATAPIANPVGGVNAFTFSPAVTIPKGTQFWIGMCADTTAANNVLYAWQMTPYSTMGLRDTSATGYASWPPTNPAAGTVVGAFAFGAIITPSNNADLVCDQFIDGAGSYVFDSNVGDADFYSLQPASGSPGTVLGVTTRAWISKNDGGARSAAVQLKSGSTTVQSTSTPLLTAFGWLSRVDTVDPATGVAWTAAGVNNAQIGAVVTL